MSEYARSNCHICQQYQEDHTNWTQIGDPGVMVSADLTSSIGLYTPLTNVPVCLAWQGYFPLTMHLASLLPVDLLHRVEGA